MTANYETIDTDEPDKIPTRRIVVTHIDNLTDLYRIHADVSSTYYRCEWALNPQPHSVLAVATGSRTHLLGWPIVAPLAAGGPETPLI